MKWLGLLSNMKRFWWNIFWFKRNEWNFSTYNGFGFWHEMTILMIFEQMKCSQIFLIEMLMNEFYRNNDLRFLIQMKYFYGSNEMSWTCVQHEMNWTYLTWSDIVIWKAWIKFLVHLKEFWVFWHETILVYDEEWKLIWHEK